MISFKARVQKSSRIFRARNVYRAKILSKDERIQRLTLEVDGLQFSMPISLCRDSIEVGKEVDLLSDQKRS